MERRNEADPATEAPQPDSKRTRPAQPRGLNQTISPIKKVVSFFDIKCRFRTIDSNSETFGSRNRIRGKSRRDYTHKKKR